MYDNFSSMDISLTFIMIVAVAVGRSSPCITIVMAIAGWTAECNQNYFFQFRPLFSDKFDDGFHHITLNVNSWPGFSLASSFLHSSTVILLSSAAWITSTSFLPSRYAQIFFCFRFMIFSFRNLQFVLRTIVCTIY